jgi:hypothetical protein
MSCVGVLTLIPRPPSVESFKNELCAQKEWLAAAGRDKSDPDADQSCQGLTNYLLSLVFKCVNDSVLVRVCRYVIATGSIG